MAGEVRVGSLVVTDDDRTYTKSFDGRGEFILMIPLPFEEIYIQGTLSRVLAGG